MQPDYRHGGGYISPDGYWWWDGARWLPLYPGASYGQETLRPKPWWQRTPTLIIAGVLLVAGSVGLGLTVLIGLAALTLTGASQAPSSSGAPGPSSTSPTSSTSWSSKGDPNAVSGAPIDGINCGLETVTVHFHAHLALFLDGREVAVPGGIGMSRSGQCLYSLHTHQADGMIHAESPVPTAYTLGQFFDIWGETLSTTQSGPITALPGQTLHVYVNGTPYSGNPRDIQLRSHQAVVIEAGQVVPVPTVDFRGL
jgi:hypothetical protein